MARDVIKNLTDLDNYAKHLAARLRGGAVVALSGELGAGKTTLVQSVGRALGVRANILSPTFTILKVYPVAKQDYHQLCHVDLYRVSDFTVTPGLIEYIGDKDTVCFIEWAEKIKSFLPKNTLWLTIKITAGELRVIIQKNKLR
ncbi:MAG: tRNA (adenosine(37)-N6)-threonylcarbamoyltransferase complex ATPase subunit type 1 TsaE [Candidatus Komeilibacteria bacterium]|nr:tRNA (adenosine(37)-N6)-threonylcarbamoyltransferase complex ATPase subunit type 1 TsaE [Candidatus Komeilibacteria bacterium]